MDGTLVSLRERSSGEEMRSTSITEATCCAEAGGFGGEDVEVWLFLLLREETGWECGTVTAGGLLTMVLEEAVAEMFGVEIPSQRWAMALAADRCWTEYKK